MTVFKRNAIETVSDIVSRCQIVSTKQGLYKLSLEKMLNAPKNRCYLQILNSNQQTYLSDGLLSFGEFHAKFYGTAYGLAHRHVGHRQGKQTHLVLV